MSTQRLALVAVTVLDYDEAIAFYTERLGFTLTEDTDLGNEKRWVTVSPPGATNIQANILLARAVTPEQKYSVGNQTGGRVFLFLRTNNFQEDYERLTANGVTFVRPPHQEPFGTVAVFEDLYGNRFDLIQHNP